MAAISFRGLTEEQLIEIRDAALEQMKKGSMVVSGSTGGKSFGRQVTSTPEQRFKAAMDELRRLDPNRYGKIDDRTVVQFT